MQYTTPGYGDNKISYSLGIGKEFIISEKIMIMPVFKALGTFYLIILFFYSTSTSLQVMAGYKF